MILMFTSFWNLMANITNSPELPDLISVYLPFRFTTAITLIALLQYFSLGVFVSFKRYKHGIQAPKITGNEKFERAFRIHQNTLEQIVLFLPLLWVFSYLVSDIWGGILGLAWVFARFGYAYGYYKHPKHRTIGMNFSSAIILIMFFWAILKLTSLL